MGSGWVGGWVGGSYLLRLPNGTWETVENEALSTGRITQVVLDQTHHQVIGNQAA